MNVTPEQHVCVYVILNDLHIKQALMRFALRGRPR